MLPFKFSATRQRNVGAPVEAQTNILKHLPGDVLGTQALLETISGFLVFMTSVQHRMLFMFGCTGLCKV